MSVPLTRRALLAAGLAAATGEGSANSGSALPSPAGAEHPLASFDREMEAYLESHGVPGGALAVVRGGRLVHARGYGWADREARKRVEPASLFRIASVSKPITAVAVLQLVEQGRLGLDTPAFPLLGLEPILERGREPDPALRKVTIRHLLQHTGGWDRERSYDPMFSSRLIARVAGTPSPAGPREVIRYMLGRPLDFEPGARYAYSNFGYCVLGRVIERITGMPYERYVREKVLAPMGIRSMRIGASLEAGRAPGEVRYYLRKERLVPSVFGEKPEPVPHPYGGFFLEAMDSHGGWIASAVDLARFAASFHDPEQCPVLKAATIRTMFERPALPPDEKDPNRYYACGWSVREFPARSGRSVWHTGSLPGTWALLVRRWDGLAWAALFNQRSDDASLDDGAIDSALHRAAATVRQWPEVDLFRRRE